MSSPTTSEPGTGLDIRLFGTLEITVAGRPMPRLRSRKGQWLLAMLCLKQGSEVSREWIAGNLWPDSEPERAAANLRLSLCDLRRALGPESVRLQSPTSRTLRLALDGSAMDVAEFDAALAKGDQESLALAVAFYRGPLLDECSEPWVDLDRRQREQACLAALEALAETAITCGDHVTAEGYLHRARQMEPLRESIYVKLMQALASRGDVAAAQQVYRNLRVLLRNELNVDPCQETQEAYRELREATNRSAIQRLPDQAPAPKVRADVTRAVHRLPRPLTEFVGRQREVERLKPLILQNRLVTLTGPAGIGKTRLAIEVAQALMASFGDGVCFADLAPIEDSRLVPSVILNAAGAHAEIDRVPEVPETGVMADRNLLVVIDNCEHLVEVCALTVDNLLAESPHLHVLATSHQALAITGEIDWRVQPLSLLGEGAKGDATDPSEAVLLFLQRAQAARPDFALTESNAQTVAAVCSRLDGIPLALELAAARLKLLTIEQIASRLDDRFKLLSAGSRTAIPRHRTLEAALDWSYALLSDPERMLLIRLSVFPGRFDLESAQAICSIPDLGEEVFDLLGQLADKSFVSVEEDAGEALYRLLETTRAYARKRLTPGEKNLALHASHSEYFLAYAERVYPMLNSSQAAEWLDRLEMRSDDFRAALAWFSDQGTTIGRESGLRLANALWPYWHTRYEMGDASMHAPNNVWSEAVVWLEKLLSGDPPCCAATAKAQAQLATLARKREISERARELFQASLSICEELGDLATAASTLRSLAMLTVDGGDNVGARRLLEQALDLSRKSGDRAETAQTLTALGTRAIQDGDIAFAQRVMDEALCIQRDLGHPLGISAALTNVGVAALAAGELRASRAAHEESLAINESLKHSIGIGWSLDNLAEVALAMGEIQRAAKLYRSSSEVFHSLGNRSGIADCLVGVAEICLIQRKPVLALRLLEGASALRHRRSHVSINDQERFNRLNSAAAAAISPEIAALAEIDYGQMSIDGAYKLITQALDMQGDEHDFDI